MDEMPRSTLSGGAEMDLRSQLDALDDTPTTTIAPKSEPDADTQELMQQLRDSGRLDQVKRAAANETDMAPIDATARSQAESHQAMLDEWDKEVAHSQALLADPSISGQPVEILKANLTFARRRRDEIRAERDKARALQVESLSDFWQPFAQAFAPQPSEAKALQQYAESAGAEGLAAGAVGLAEYLGQEIDASGWKPLAMSEIGGLSDFGRYMEQTAGSAVGTLAHFATIGAATGGSGVIADLMAQGHGQMRQALEEAGVTDKASLAKGTYTYGTLIGGLQAVVPWAVMRGLTAPAQAAFVGSLAQISARVATGSLKMGLAQTIAMSLASVAQTYGITDVTGKPIDWDATARQVLAEIPQNAITGTLFGAFGEAGKIAGGGYKLRSSDEQVQRFMEMAGIKPGSPQAEEFMAAKAKFDADRAAAAQAALPRLPAPATGETAAAKPGAAASEAAAPATDALRQELGALATERTSEADARRAEIERQLAETETQAPAKPVSEEEAAVRADLAKEDAALGEPVLAQAFNNLTDAERQEIAARAKKGENPVDLVEEVSIRGVQVEQYLTDNDITLDDAAKRDIASRMIDNRSIEEATSLYAEEEFLREFIARERGAEGAVTGRPAAAGGATGTEAAGGEPAAAAGPGGGPESATAATGGAAAAAAEPGAVASAAATTKPAAGREPAAAGAGLEPGAVRPGGEPATAMGEGGAGPAKAPAAGGPGGAARAFEPVFTRDEITVSAPRASTTKYGGKRVANINAPSKVTEPDNWNRLGNIDATKASVVASFERKAGAPKKTDAVWSVYGDNDARGPLLASGMTFNDAVERAKDHVNSANPAVPSVSTPKNFWTYQAGETPTVSDLPPGYFKGTQHDFEKLSPGMRREILRTAQKQEAAIPAPTGIKAPFSVYAIPADGSPPYLSFIQDLGSGAEAEKRAHENARRNRALSTQKLAGYEFRNKEGESHRFNFEASLASATESAAKPAPAITPAQRDQFRETLRGNTPRKQWASELGVSPAEMDALIKDAEAQGLLRVDRNGIVRRTAKARTDEPTPEEQMLAIRAFHGSPHEFERFDISKLGTGEGAQSFGHGLYFAENPEVAISYQIRLSPMKSLTYKGRDIANAPKINNPNYMRGHGYLISAKGVIADAIKMAEADLADMSTYNRQQLADVVKELKNDWKQKTSGNLYEVSIDVEPHQLLDWDKPLSEQSPQVKRAFEKLPRALDEIEAYTQVHGSEPDMSYIIRTFPDVSLKTMEGPKGVTKMLREAGIPGIRYLDQGSRAEGEGTHNIVIFDDKLIKITHKNGEPVTAKERSDALEQMHGEQDAKQMLALRGFYSPAIRAVESITQEKGTGEQFWKQITKVPGVRKDELDWMGLEEFLKDKKSITKADVLDFMRANQAQLDERMLGGKKSDRALISGTVSPERFRRETGADEAAFPDAKIQFIEKFSVHGASFYVVKELKADTYSVLGAGLEKIGKASSRAEAEHIGQGWAASKDIGPRFSDYKVPGGDNYRELLIRLPELGAPRELTIADRERLAEINAELADLATRPRGGLSAKDATKIATHESVLTNEKLRLERPAYTSKHFQDQELVHLRVDDRYIPAPGPSAERAAAIREQLLDLNAADPEAKALREELNPKQKVLFINEVQSDLHQTAQGFGYGTEGLKAAKDAISSGGFRPKEHEEYFQLRNEGDRDADALAERARKRVVAAENYIFTFPEGAPNVPLKGDLWLELALKRALQYATENGYDAISWARSDQIAKAVGAEPEKLALQYDQKIGKFLDKYTKKWGGKVEEEGRIVSTTWDEESGRASVGGFNPILRITPEMRDSIARGQPLFAITDDQGRVHVMRQLSAGRQVDIEPRVVSHVHQAMAAVATRLPEGTRIGALTHLKPAKGKADRYTGTFTNPDGSRFSMPLAGEHIWRGRAIFDRKTGTIMSLRFGAFPGDPLGDQLVMTTRGEIYHETVHAVWRSLPHAVRARLLAHAESLKILDMPTRDYLRQIGDPSYKDIRDNGTLRQDYEDLYRRNRKDILEEAVAHMAELYSHGLLTDEQVAPVKGLLDAIISDPAALVEQAGEKGGAQALLAQRGQRLDATQPLTPAYEAAASDVLADIRKAMKLLPAGWRYEVDDKLIHGLHFGATDAAERIVYISLAADDPAAVAYEEAGHVLRQFIPHADYEILRREAKRLRAREHFDIDERYAKLYAQQIDKAVLEMPPESAAFFRPLLEKRIPDRLEEEAIMQMVAAHATGKEFGTPASKARRILDRIVKFLRAVGEALKGRGFRTYESVFDDLTAGRFAPSAQEIRGKRGLPGTMMFALRPRGPDITETFADIRAELGLKMPEGPKKGKPPSLRTQIVAIASEGGRQLLQIYRDSLMPVVAKHRGAIEEMALPLSTDRIGDGFSRFFREFVLRPNDLRARQRALYDDFSDFLDAEAPQLLESIDEMHRLGRERLMERRAAMDGVPGTGAPGGAGGGKVPPAGGGSAAGAGGTPPSGGGGNIPGLPPSGRQLPAAFRQFVDGWKRNFQPELISLKALEADPLFASYRAAAAQLKDAIVKRGEELHAYWRKLPERQRLDFIRDLELGADQPTEGLAEIAWRYRQLLDQAHRDEAVYGSKAGYVEDYFPHIWMDAAKAREVFKAMSAAKNLGPKWFEKERFYDLIEEGLKAGLELKSTNPEELIAMRLMAGADMRMRMELLQQLKKMGLARETKGADNAGFATAGWQAINAPNMEQWLISPDIVPLWENAVEARGLWTNEKLPGSIFRGWMAFKSAWVPIKLTASMFHPLHVLHINMANDFARAWVQLTRAGDVRGAAASFLDAFTPTQGIGYDARHAWTKSDAERTPFERAIVQLMIDGGFKPQMDEMLKNKAKQALQNAIQDGKWLKALPLGAFRLLQKLMMQDRIFEHWIPGVKAAAYLKEAHALLERRPDLLDDNIQRRVALRAIAKSVDNRFGEMNYSALFWNRTVKDMGIASFLSLGWNLGFVREFGGGATQPIARRFMPSSRPRDTIRASTNKTAFVIAYVSSAALINGIMNYLFSGEMPKGYDYIFPRIGGLNPDGSPRRITNMFYTREVPMLTKHIEEQGGWNPGGVLFGTGEMLWNKMMFQPFVEMAENRDYWGYEIWDTNAPLYKQAEQFAWHILKDQLTPMTSSGAQRARDIGGSWLDKGVPLSFLGFGPAPAYVERTPLENRIRYLYTQFVAPLKKPYEREAVDDVKREAKQELKLALQRGDQQAAADARKKAREAGVRSTYLTQRKLNVPSSAYLFSRLPPETQRDLLQNASPAEVQLYRKYANRKLRREFPAQVTFGQGAPTGPQAVH